jgi:hypothetical protein
VPIRRPRNRRAFRSERCNMRYDALLIGLQRIAGRGHQRFQVTGGNDGQAMSRLKAEWPARSQCMQ